MASCFMPGEYARLTRLSSGFSKKLENLEAAVAVFLEFYDFVWRTRQ